MTTYFLHEFNEPLGTPVENTNPTYGALDVANANAQTNGEGSLVIGGCSPTLYTQSQINWANDFYLETKIKINLAENETFLYVEPIVYDEMNPSGAKVHIQFWIGYYNDGSGVRLIIDNMYMAYIINYVQQFSDDIYNSKQYPYSIPVNGSYVELDLYLKKSVNENSVIKLEFGIKNADANISIEFPQQVIENLGSNIKFDTLYDYNPNKSTLVDYIYAGDVPYTGQVSSYFWTNLVKCTEALNG